MEYNHRPNVGDMLYVIHPSYRKGVPSSHQLVKVIKVARAFVTLEEIPEDPNKGVMWGHLRVWKMRIDGQREDSAYSYAPYYRTPSQLKTHQLYRTSRDFLHANGITLDGKRWQDEREVIKLAFHVADLIQPTPTDD